MLRKPPPTPTHQQVGEAAAEHTYDVEEVPDVHPLFEAAVEAERPEARVAVVLVGQLVIYARGQHRAHIRHSIQQHLGQGRGCKGGEWLAWRTHTPQRTAAPGAGQGVQGGGVASTEHTYAAAAYSSTWGRAGGGSG